MPSGYVIRKSDSPYPHALLKRYEDWGVEAVDLVAPPRRLWADQPSAESPVTIGVEAGSVEALPHPSALLTDLPPGDNWPAQSRRSLARLQAYFLICEDPDRRLDTRAVDTLSHQVSLVRHILENDHLRRVLIADEVGLGKTIEVGLLLAELLQQRPELRVLYLAPARLVSNVRAELGRLQLPFRQWSALDGDARLTDSNVVASLQRAVHGENFQRMIAANPWDVLIVDECHHLSAWEYEGGKPSLAYRLVRELIGKQSPDGRVILLSGTPHQGHETRFENLLQLLRGQGEDEQSLTGRVIYRTKDDIRDWDGNPVFPRRMVNTPLVIDLGLEHQQWMRGIHDFYKPSLEEKADSENGHSRVRAAGWRCAQAMQWAASSPHAGLGYLVRQAIRAGWASSNSVLRDALAAIRPYRLGSADESLDSLHRRISQEVARQRDDNDLDDIEDFVPGDVRDCLSTQGLEALIRNGTHLIYSSGDEKWEKIKTAILDPAGDEKVVLFAQPIETVSALAGYLERTTGVRPAMVIGGQDDATRGREIEAFRRADGPRFLVSSRAGGEGINLQVARRLVHIDVPWNPMDMEQRVGRVHRFGSRETIIVDTVVVKNSREAHAYEIARDRLKLIAHTMVPQERFENVFGRVMCLLGLDELQTIMISDPISPFNAGDKERLAAMVQDGYTRWERFDTKYGQLQKSITAQSAGLTTWDDMGNFLLQYGDVKKSPGHSVVRFRQHGEAVNKVETSAEVLSFTNGESYACADYSGALVCAPDGRSTLRLGLNLSRVAEVLRTASLPELVTGAAWLRWPAEGWRPAVQPGSFGVLAFLRQTLKQDSSGQWSETGLALALHLVQDGASQEIAGAQKGEFLRTLFRCTVRKTAAEDTSIAAALKTVESGLIDTLRRPGPEEMRAGIRHAVTPLFASVITL